MHGVEVGAEYAVAHEDVELAKMFGSDGLRVGGKFFATFSKEDFVVKLPRERVDKLVADGDGVRFDPGSGRPMKEWVVLAPGSAAEGLAYLDEALAFVSSTL